MSNEKQQCPYCGVEAIISKGNCLNDVDCPICGNYKYKGWPVTYGEQNKNEIASYLYYKKCEENGINYIISDNEEDVNSPDVRVVDLDEIISVYPSNFANRVNLILMGLAKESEYMGDILQFTGEELISRLYIKRFDKGGNPFLRRKKDEQLTVVLDYLETEEYIEYSGNYEMINMRLTPKGWSRIDELQVNSSNNKNVFVSMAFNENTKDIRETLRKAIIESGYSPEFIDEIIHNKQIVPEMFRLIRECNFLILEISEPNYGAYYEAGYALGLGKEVIICCKKDIFTKDFGKDEMHLKPHFDVVQKQILLWEDLDDLQVKLCEWIKAII